MKKGRRSEGASMPRFSSLSGHAGAANYSPLYSIDLRDVIAALAGAPAPGEAAHDLRARLPMAVHWFESHATQWQGFSIPTLGVAGYGQTADQAAADLLAACRRKVEA